jgi:hypothetical protein
LYHVEFPSSPFGIRSPVQEKDKLYILTFAKSTTLMNNVQITLIFQKFLKFPQKEWFFIKAILFGFLICTLPRISQAQNDFISRDTKKPSSDITRKSGDIRNSLQFRIGFGGGANSINSNADTIKDSKPAVFYFPIDLEYYPIHKLGLGVTYQFGDLTSRDSTFQFKGSEHFIAPYIILRLIPEDIFENHIYASFRAGIGFTWQEFSGINEENLDQRINGNGIWGFGSVSLQINIKSWLGFYIETGLRYMNIKDFKEKESETSFMTNEAIPESVFIKMVGWNFNVGVVFLVF